MNKEGNTVTQTEILENIKIKIEDDEFIGDMHGLLRTGINFDINEAYNYIKTNLLKKI